MSLLHKGEDEWSTICWLNNIPIPSARAVSSVKDLRSGAVLLQLTQVHNIHVNHHHQHP